MEILSKYGIRSKVRRLDNTDKLVVEFTVKLSTVLEVPELKNRDGSQVAQLVVDKGNRDYKPTEIDDE